MDTDAARRQMVEQQIRTWDVDAAPLLSLLNALPRHRFVPRGYEALAYADMEIPLGHGEIMMQPAVEGRILQALEIEAQDRILEVGTGSGYLTACLARLGAEVVSVDLQADFTDSAKSLLDELAIANVSLQTRDAVREGLPAGEFDVVVITGSLPRFDKRLLASLTPGGRLFVVTGEAPIMDARIVVRGDGAHWTQSSLFETCLPRLRHVDEPSSFVF